jgi:hypothetical protein
MTKSAAHRLARHLGYRACVRRHRAPGGWFHTVALG